MTTDGISRKADILKVTSEQEVTATSKQGLIPEGISVQWEQQGPFPGLRSEKQREVRVTDQLATGSHSNLSWCLLSLFCQLPFAASILFLGLSSRMDILLRAM